MEIIVRSRGEGGVWIKSFDSIIFIESLVIDALIVRK